MDIGPHMGSGTIARMRLKLDPSAPAIDQLANLRDDLVAIRYHDGYAVELGWFPAHDLHGHFECDTIRNGDAERPLLLVAFRRVRQIPGLMSFCSAFVEWLTESADTEVSPTELVACLGSGQITCMRDGLAFDENTVSRLGESDGDLLLRVGYPNGITVGLWYRLKGPWTVDGGPMEGEPEFRVLVVGDGDWDYPEMNARFSDIRWIPKLLALSSTFVESLTERGGIRPTG